MVSTKLNGVNKFKLVRLYSKTQIDYKKTSTIYKVDCYSLKSCIKSEPR